MSEQHNQAGGGRNGSVPAGHGTTTTGHGTTTTGQDNAPVDAGKPKSPTKLTKPSWKYIARKPCGNSATTNAPTSPRR